MGASLLGVAKSIYYTCYERQKEGLIIWFGSIGNETQEYTFASLEFIHFVNVFL